MTYKQLNMNYLKLSLLLLFGLAGLAACKSAAPVKALVTTPNRYAITNISIVDVEKGIAIPGQTVTIVEDRIDQVGVREKVEIPQGAKIIDGNGLYLMPGLADAHVHYFDAPVFGRLMIANGVLLVRDTGMPNEYILPLRDQLNRGELLGPVMVAAGVILDGYPPIIPSISVGLLTPEEGRAAVRRQVEAGADIIKAYSRLDRDVFMAILDEANKYGIKVVAHLPETVYLEDAAAAGLASSEHFNGFEKVIAKHLGEPVNLKFAGQARDANYFARLDEVDPQEMSAVYQRLHESDITICPTVVTFKTLTHIKGILNGSVPKNQYISQRVFEMWKALWPAQEDLPDFLWRNWARMVSDLNKNDVPLMVGTDLMLPGIVPGDSVHQEMVIWQEAGIPPADILRGATIVPAELMGKADRLGSVSVNKTASIVLLRANPLEDIRNAQQIEGVFLRGKYFSRQDLDQLLLEAKELAQQPVPESTKSTK